MTTKKKDDLATRDSLLKLLSDDETARVSTAEGGTHKLADGEQYLDLNLLTRGVQIADGAPQPIGSLLPRKAVSAETWEKILVHLVPRSIS